MQKSTRNTMVATKMPLEAKKGPKNAKYWSKNPDEKFYLDFGDQNLKSIKNHFPPGPDPRNATFPKNLSKKNRFFFFKNPKNPLTLIPLGGVYGKFPTG